MSHSMVAMLAMTASVSLVLANRYTDPLLSGEGIKTEFFADPVVRGLELGTDGDISAGPWVGVQSTAVGSVATTEHTVVCETVTSRCPSPPIP